MTKPKKPPTIYQVIAYEHAPEKLWVGMFYTVNDVVNGGSIPRLTYVVDPETGKAMFTTNINKPYRTVGTAIVRQRHSECHCCPSPIYYEITKSTEQVTA